MLSENLKNIRKSKGLSQEDLAIKLHVVRQTVSKWEKGLSVPDSEMLIQIAEELETSVGELLGETVEPVENTELKEIAIKLERLNDQFARRNELRRKTWRIVFCVIGLLAAVCLLLTLASLHAYGEFNESMAVIGGADGPTAIFVTRSAPIAPAVISALAVVASGIGIYGTRRK